MLVAVMPGTVHLPCLLVVLQIDLEALVDHALLELFFKHRSTDLDTTEKLPVHPARTGQIDIVLQALAELEDAGVLEKAPDHRTHLYVFG